MLMAFSIKAKIFIISIITAVALAMIASLTWYRSYYVAQINEDEHHVLEIEVLLLKLDKTRGFYASQQNSIHLDEFERLYSELIEGIEHLASEAETLGVDPSFLDELSDNVWNYHSLFLSMADFLQKVGKDESDGIRNKMHASLEAALGVLNNIPDADARSLLRHKLLNMRHQGEDLSALQADDHLEKFDEQYHQLIVDAERLITENQFRQDFTHAVDAYHKLAESYSVMIEMIGVTHEDGLRWQLDTVAQSAYEEISDVMKLIAVTSDKKEKQIGTVIVVVSITLSIAILFLIHLLGRSITRPLREMTIAMGGMANGDYKDNIPGKGRRDEIGEIAAALEIFADNAKSHEDAKQALQKANEKLEEHVAERTKSLSESESALFNMIHESPIAIGLTDENGTPVFWNDSFLKFGWRKDTPGASNDFQLMFAKPDLRREFFERLQRDEQVRNEEVEIITASEEPAWVEMSIQSLIFEGQKSYLTWVHDITERKLREEIQAKARRSAEEANQAKSNFLATMSHEIRTPLNGIMTMAEMLETTDLTTEQKGMATIVRDSSSTLVSIINDVLDFSKIESGNLELDLANMSLVQVVESVADLLGAQVAEKNIHLFTFVDPEAHDFFLGDSVRLRQILTNLAGNAVKFTEHGEVIIEVTLENSFPDRATAVFRVIDSGVGISPENQAKLFQPFVQADSSTARRFGGSGLGLSISKALIEAMDGEIGLESTPGLGSTFWIKVPLKAQKEQRASRKGQLAGKRGIIVSENSTFSNVLENYLNFVGMRAETVAGFNRLEALFQVAGESRKDMQVMLVDGDLPEQFIEDLLGQVKSHSDMKDIQVVAMGYRSTMMVERPVYLEHVFAELPMPIRRNQLWEVAAAAAGVESLDSALLYNGRESDVGSRKFAPPDVATARDAGALILVAEDNPVNQKVISMLLDRLGYAADIVEDGVEALEALRNTPYGLLLSDCHMPNLDGYDLAREIRKGEVEQGLPRLPIVALTADALIGVEEKCRECGMDSYLKKPISREELNTTILKLLPQASSLRRHAGNTTGVVEVATKAFKARDVLTPEKPVAGITPTDAAASVTKTGAFDVTYLEEVSGGDPEMIKMLVDSYIDTTPPLIDDLVSALEANDAAMARETAHAIKGASKMSGAVRLGVITEKIQMAATDDNLASVDAYKDMLHQEFDAFLTAWKGHANG